MRIFKRPHEEGQGLVEYALVLVLVGIIVIIILATMGKSVGDIFCGVMYDLGGSVPNNAQVCVNPHVTFIGTIGTVHHGDKVNIEAKVQNNKGSTGTNISNVVFYINGTVVQTENNYKYCLGQGDTSCSDYTIPNSLPLGTNTLKAVATDNATPPNTGEYSITFTVAP